MKKLLLLLAAILPLCGLAQIPVGETTLSAYQDGVMTVETFLHSVKDGDSLFLDKYSTVATHQQHKAAVIFAFGGGFVGGARNHKGYLPFFQLLAHQGYLVLSIDYRLGMKGIGSASNIEPEDMAAMLARTVNMAAEDFLSATAFVIEHAQSLKVDPSKIIACGSSAGAITALNAEYAICRGEPMTAILPEGFNYAGVISMAGAMFDVTGDLSAVSRFCPVFWLHGDADSNVPYDKVNLGQLGFYGPKYLSEVFSREQIPYWFYSFTDADHSVASLPMTQNPEQIIYFIENYALGGKKSMTTTYERRIGAPGRFKHFSIEDYIISNFGM